MPVPNVSTVQQIPLDLITPSPHNPRTTLGDIEELSASLQDHGLLQPVVVRRRARGFELIAGHRRLEAAKRLQWETIPALVHEATADPYILTLVENLQRTDLTPAEEAAGLVELMRQYRWTTRQVAAAIKRSQAYVSKRLRIFEDPALRRAVLEDGLAPSTAEELLTVKPARRRDLLERAVAEGWGVAQVRAAIRERPALPDEPIDSTSSARQRRVAGLARATREVREILRRVFPEDLSDADRKDLRLLFLDLAKIAQSQPGPRKVVLPRLPASSSLRAG